EIDVIGRHDATSRLSGLVGIVEWRGFPFNGRTPLIPIHARTGEESMLNMTLWPAVALALTCSTAMASDIRRVVTGLDANNKAVVLFDGRLALAPGPYGITSTNMWITDSYPPGLSFTKDDPAARPIAIPPPNNGPKFRVGEFPPLDAATEAKMDPNLLMKAVGEKAPVRGVPVTHPLMHRTRSLDYAVVLSGEIDMMLD